MTIYGRIMAVGRSRIEKTAEGEGFEPPGTCIPRLFKSLAFGRSAIPPDLLRLLRTGVGICGAFLHPGVWAGITSLTVVPPVANML